MRRVLIEDIAKVCHEVNKAYCESIGDKTQLSWENCYAFQRESAIAGVKAVLENPEITAMEIHEKWVSRKLFQGWRYGKEKDIQKKLHPCMVAYCDLPPEQRAKDLLVISVVRSLQHLLRDS